MGKAEYLTLLQIGQTGVLFKNQTVEDLKSAILKSEDMNFDKKTIRDHAMKFDESEFRKKIMDFVKEKYSERKQLKRTYESCNRCQNV